MKSILDAVKEFAAWLAVVTAICYVVGYLSSVGYSLKLGLPVSLRSYEVLLARGASFPLGVLANLVITYIRFAWWLVPITVVLIAVGVTRRRWITPGLRRIMSGAWKRLELFAIPVASVLVMVSVYLAWKPVQHQGLLLERPPYIDGILRSWKNERQLEQQLQLDTAVADAERDPARRLVLDDRVNMASANLTDAQRELEAGRAAALRQHQLVYCVYFQMDPRCHGVASTHYSSLCIWFAAAFGTTFLAFKITKGRFRDVLPLLAALLTLNIALGLVDYGWILLGTDVNVVSREGESTELLLLGDHDDRFLFYRFEPPAVLMTAKSTINQLSIHRRVELFSEILRRAAHGDQ